MSAMSERTKRLFLALWPSDPFRSELADATRHATIRSGGRPIPAVNLHITLAFLGATPESRLVDVIGCIRSIAVRPFELIVGELKWWKRQELLCLEPVAGGEALKSLAQEVKAALRVKGFDIEHRPFRAHLTLARDVRREHDFEPIKPLRWQVNRVDLVESRTAPTGSIYTVLPT